LDRGPWTGITGGVSLSALELITRGWPQGADGGAWTGGWLMALGSGKYCFGYFNEGNLADEINRFIQTVSICW